MGNKTLVTGPALVRAGYVVLCIDAYAFGERRFQGPAGKREEGAATEWALAKTFLWEGRTLWGMIVRDDVLALNYLASRPEVNPARIGAMGMSMGSTRTWWIAALDDRIKAAVSVSCLTRYQDLIHTGWVNGHGIYYFVPGMLHEKIDAESVVGLIAPRPLDARRRRRPWLPSQRRPHDQRLPGASLQALRQRGQLPRRRLSQGGPRVHARNVGRDPALAEKTPVRQSLGALCRGARTFWPCCEPMNCDSPVDEKRISRTPRESRRSL